MHKYIIMGAQGSGKGTQSRMLQEDYGLVHISVGDILRWNIQNHTKLGARVKRIVADGLLVPDEMVEEIVKDRLEQHDWNFGFILDGFPRSYTQAEFFLENYDVDAVIVLDVSDDAVLDRILSRRLCCDCGLDYNLIHHRPQISGVCDVCGGKLIVRADDQISVVRERLRDYRMRVQPMLELFQRKELVITVDASGSVDLTHKSVQRQIHLRRSRELVLH